MKDKFLNWSESNTIARNLEMIESSLGRKVPFGLIDFSDLSDHYLSYDEVLKIKMNIDMIESSRAHNNSPAIAWIYAIGGLAGIAYIIVAIIYSMFS